MREIVFHPAAATELEDALRYYLEIDPPLAGKFFDSYQLHRDRAAALPNIYRVRRQKVRRVNLHPIFNERYIAFMILQGRMVILAIGHAKQRPFYFSSRLREAKQLFSQ